MIIYSEKCTYKPPYLCLNKDCEYAEEGEHHHPYDNWCSCKECLEPVLDLLVAALKATEHSIMEKLSENK